MSQVLKIQKKEVTKMGQLAVIAKEGVLQGRVVEVLPQSYLQPSWEWAEDKKTKIQFPIKREELVIL